MWHDSINSQRSIITYDLSSLSNNQKIVLKDLAKHNVNQPYSHEVLLRTRLTIASQKEAIKKLTFKDFIYTNHLDFIRVLDPAIRSYILVTNK